MKKSRNQEIKKSRNQEIFSLCTGKILLIFVLMCLVLSSCYTLEVQSGNCMGKPLSKVSEHKNHYLFYGLIPLNQPQKVKDVIGDKKDYVIKSYFSLIDYLICDFTGGLYTPSTTEYYVPIF